MATSAVQYSVEGSADAEGLSLVTSLKTAENPGLGSIYSPAFLAAAVPVWFHPLNDGDYLAVMRSHWTNATVGTTGPQAYSSVSHIDVPSTVRVNPTIGLSGPVTPLKSDLAGARLLSGAASRFGNLYTVGKLDGVAHLQWFRPIRDTINLAGEELLPLVGADDVSFHLGCYVFGDFLHVFGAAANDQLHMARKRWARIGTNADRTATYTWEYLGTKGWLDDPAELAPLKDTSGQIIESAGPVSYARHRDRALMVVTHNISGNRTAIGYVSRDVESRWRRSPFIAPALGDGDTYLGGTAYLQSSLHVNQPEVPEGTYVAFPAVSSVLVEESGDMSIQTEWTVWPIFR